MIVAVEVDDPALVLVELWKYVEVVVVPATKGPVVVAAVEFSVFVAVELVTAVLDSLAPVVDVLVPSTTLGPAEVGLRAE